MKRLNYLILSMTLISAMMLSLSSCDDDEDEKAPAPTVQILQASVDGYDVALTIAATNATSYAWDFGDDTGTSTAENPTYTYTESGTYTITVTVTGESGTATDSKEVSIAASKHEMLTGGAGLSGGKSWVMSQTHEVDVLEAEDGTLEDIDDTNPAGIVGVLVGASEYEDTFTYHNDGNYTQDPENGAVVGSILYSTFEELDFTLTSEILVLTEFTAPTDAGFTYNEDDLTMSVMPDANLPAEVEDVTYTGFDYINITGGGFIGVLEWPRDYIVFELTNDKLVLGVFAHFPQDPVPGSDYFNFEPTHLLRITFIPAE